MRPAPFCIAGILNVTPDSFATGTGETVAVAASVRAGLAMLDELRAFGCGMLDVGAESTRPGAPFVPEEEEAARLFPVLEGLFTACPDALVSVDTTRAGIAARALDMGAAVINDVSACGRDPELVHVLAQYKPGYVLTHGGGVGGARGGAAGNTQADRPIVDDVCRFFADGLQRLTAAGLPEDRIVLDPGIGFGKTPEQNWTLLRAVTQMTTLGRPLYVGLSMKSLFRMLPDGDSTAARKTATQAAVALLAGQGVRYHRVHDVNATAVTLRVAEALTHSE